MAQRIAGSRLTGLDLHLLAEGSHYRLYDKLGAHPVRRKAGAGVHFGVWAPNAAEVSAIGDFNDWDPEAHPMRQLHGGSGVWEAFVPGAKKGQRYKFRIVSRNGAYTVDKADPYAFHAEEAPNTASVVWDLDGYKWGDGEWMAQRATRNALDAPMSVYELHLGSWRRDDNRMLSYRELAPQLADYCEEMGFTHVELLPVMEHPFYGSWGYQVTGYFAPTSRYGTPQDFMYLVDHLHRRGIGVILDWVPSHFPSDQHGLHYFDGTFLYEHADPKKGFHPEWSSYIFNYGRNEVRAFLLSSALFWLDYYHIDGLRVDAVASMLYLDYARKHGEWIPNEHGGNENLEAIGFLRQLNEAVYREHADTQVIAEESTAWPMVSRPTYLGGLGFGMKWNMGWMHDTLKYFGHNPIHRRYHHGELTFSLIYAFNENFMLPLSHDEVVHGKGSLIARMPGDEWQQFANLRLLYGYMWAHPGKQLLFMGGEFGQKREWAHEGQLEWFVTQYPLHAGVQAWIKDLNRFYQHEPALYEQDFGHEGFEWVEANDYEDSVISFLRKGRDGRPVLVVCNNTPIVRENYRVGVPQAGVWEECLNSDAECYGGSGQGNYGTVEAHPLPSHGRYYSLTLRLPPLGVLYLRPQS
jgi:1,4-alpha-glucan branching enzyme